jgi:hypothetical protein
MGSDMLERRLQFAVRDGVTRALGAIGLCGMALIHAIDAPSHFGGPDTYLGVMYVGLIVSSLVLAAALIQGGDRRVWTASGALAASVIVGYVLSRTTGLPSSMDDVGNWGEPLGIASLFVETSLVALATGVLAWLPRRQFVTLVPARQSTAHASSGEPVTA